jgi:hypothetical protein
MDIYGLVKYYRETQGYKYILSFADVYNRKVWAYKMKNKDNDNVFDSFKQFIQDRGFGTHGPGTRDWLSKIQHHPGTPAVAVPPLSGPPTGARGHTCSPHSTPVTQCLSLVSNPGGWGALSRSWGFG